MTLRKNFTTDVIQQEGLRKFSPVPTIASVMQIESQLNILKDCADAASSSITPSYVLCELSSVRKNRLPSVANVCDSNINPSSVQSLPLVDVNAAQSSQMVLSDVSTASTMCYATVLTEENILQRCHILSQM
ncbi:hypothetical protein EB796_001835 [Bugula neritina]|uniref:Uncharacterized protein n=1 Tax=Bugula neritina TaxID=10212 RepID=A0A7J7KNW3_BUGNE|nr:hypothetical protein EB796_001835 [Bugula neritina]